MMSRYATAAAAVALSLGTARSMSAQKSPSGLPPAPRDSTVRFLSRKPASGLPADLPQRASGTCSGDGWSVYIEHASGKNFATVYRISDTGEFQRVPLSLPLEFSGASVVSDFVGKDTIGLLAMAWEKQDPDDAAQKQGVQYLLYLEDASATQMKEPVKLDLKFKPRRVAVFGNGEAVVTGTDEGNDESVFAVIRGDGTAARFVDPASAREATAGMVKAGFASGAFFADGNNLLLAQRGGSGRVLEVTSAGDLHAYSLQLPAGYKLHDLLHSSGYGIIVARLLPTQHADRKAEMRVMEFVLRDGSLLRDLDLEGARPDDLTCAVGRSLTAVMPDPDYKKPDDQPASDKDAPLVVSVSRR